MKRLAPLLRRAGFDRIGRQITAFILISVLASQGAVLGVAALLGMFNHAGRPPIVGDDLPTYIGRTIAFGQILAKAANEDRPAIVRTLLGEPDVRVVEAATISRDGGPRAGFLEAVFRAKWPPGVAFDVPVDKLDGPVVRVRVGDVALQIGPPAVPLGAPPPLLLGIASLTGMGLAMAVLLVWGSRMLSQPLERLAGGVAKFDGSGAAAALPIDGPAEVRRLAEALNAMQARVSGLIENRTVSLAAIGHDLRTPLTRLRLRAEGIEDPEIRAGMVQDLDRMRRLTASALDFLSGRSRQETPEVIDAASLVATVADEFSEIGHSVVLKDHPPVRIEARVDALLRALTNLVENALRFGTTVEIGVDDLIDEVAFFVSDDGPGIPADQREAVMEPFTRLDSARGDERGGFGLGLAIVRAVADDHGGRLQFTDRDGGGLCVRIVIPKRAAKG